MEEKCLYPLGIRRDGSYYTRIEWCSHTETTPLFWICNLIDDDIEREGGTWAANTNGPADAVLSFFGEEQKVGRIRIFHNVGLPTSIMEEAAERICIYISDTDEPRRLRSHENLITDVPWTFVLECQMKKEECWQEFVLPEPVAAKYVRIELVHNYGTPPDIPWCETSEIKIYPE